MASRSWIRNRFTSATHIRTGERFAFSRFNDGGCAAAGQSCAVSKSASLETLCRPTFLVARQQRYKNQIPLKSMVSVAVEKENTNIRPTNGLDEFGRFAQPLRDTRDHPRV